MKLYLSSIGIPTPDDLAKLLGVPSLSGIPAALIPNAKDALDAPEREAIVTGFVDYMKERGLRANVVDLRGYSDPALLKETLKKYRLIWLMGGNTFVLRYELARSGFDAIIQDLLNNGVVYGGYSAGALVAGTSIAGIEAADDPSEAKELITTGMNLVPYVVMPHVDNEEFAEVMPVVRKLYATMIELKDFQAVIFDGDQHHIAEDKDYIAD